MDYLNLIRKIAWSFHRTTGLDYDDLFQEGCLIYFRNNKYWDKDKGKPTTFISKVVFTHLLSYTQKEFRINTPLIHPKLFPTSYFNDPIEMFDRMTEDARQISDLVLNYSNSFSVFNYDDVVELLSEVFSESGWNIDRLETGIEDLKRALAHVD